MQALNALKSAVKRALLSRGYLLSQIGDYRQLSMEAALRTVMARETRVNSVIDVGASDGRWSALLMECMPAARHYLLIEAQPVHEPALIRFCAKHAGAQYVLAAAADKVGWVNFDAGAPFEGQASYAPYVCNNLEVAATTIDHEVALRELPGPYLIKMDTHGFEIPILEGATRTLGKTEAIVMECYNFRIAPECLVFFEMCAYLKDAGFRCARIVEPVHRPFDGVLWQMDLVFIRDSRREFTYLSRHSPKEAV